MTEKNIQPGEYWLLTTGSVAKVVKYHPKEKEWTILRVSQTGIMSERRLKHMFKRKITEADACARAQSNFRRGLTEFWGLPRNSTNTKEGESHENSEV